MGRRDTTATWPTGEERRNILASLDLYCNKTYDTEIQKKPDSFPCRNSLVFVFGQNAAQSRDLWLNPTLD